MIIMNEAEQVLALQTFIKNSRYVEIIVDTAFVVIPTILGGGAAALLGKGAINVASNIAHSFGIMGMLNLGMFAFNLGRTLGGLSGAKISGAKKGRRPPGGGGGRTWMDIRMDNIRRMMEIAAQEGPDRAVQFAVQKFNMTYERAYVFLREWYWTLGYF